MFNPRSVVFFFVCSLVIVPCSAVYNVVPNDPLNFEDLDKLGPLILSHGSENDHAHLLAEISRLLHLYQEDLSDANTQNSHESCPLEGFFVVRKIKKIQAKVDTLTQYKEKIRKAHESLILSKLGIKD